MTNVREPEAPARDRAADSAAGRLRKVLLLNTEFSLLTGTAGLAAGGPIADFLDVDQVWLVRLLGAGLLAFAVAVFAISRARIPTLIALSIEVSIGDLAWVAGTAVVIALGWLSTGGAIAMGVIALIVLELGIFQLRYRQQLIAAIAA